MNTTFDPNQTPLQSIGYQNIPNILDNGSFEIWQRGTTFNAITSGAYSTDRWSVDVGSGATINIARDSSNVDSGSYSLSFNVTATSSSSCDIDQTIENGTAYIGKTLSLSVRVKSNGPVQVAIKDFGTGASSVTLSSVHPGDNQYHTLTATRTIQAGPTSLTIFLGYLPSYGGSAVTISQTYFDSAMLVIGNQPVTFVPTNPQQDLARCQRYYQAAGGSNDLAQYNMTRDASHNYFFYSRQFYVPMRVNPTMTVTMVQGILVQDAIQGTTSSTDTANWTMNNDGIDAQVFNFQGIRSTPNSTFSNIQAQISWTASADL